MKSKCCLNPGLVILMAALACADVSRAAESWTGTELHRWTVCHQCAKTDTPTGLTVVSSGTDPFLVSPPVDIGKPSIDHVVVIRGKVSKGGLGEFFYYRPGDCAAPQSLARPFEWIADGQEHEYRVRPFWQGQPKVVRFRLDFPAFANETFELTELSVVTDPIANLPVIGTADPAGGVAFTVPPLDRTVWADIEWLGDEARCFPRVVHHFHLIGDGRERRYYFDGSRCASFEGNGCREDLRSSWKGPVRRFSVFNSRTGGKLAIKDVEFTDRRPDIPGELVLSATDVALEFNRVGLPFPVEIGLFNPGTMPVRGAKAAIGGLPDGVRVVNADRAKDVVELPGWGSALHRIELLADRPCAFTLRVEFSGGGIPPVSVDVPVKVGPSLGLPRADYVPEPKPLPKGDYEIGAYYFCDWVRPEHWMKVWRTDPKRKPALGWYDNCNPEAMDWQIKWSVENGISHWLVDWYFVNDHTVVDYFERTFRQTRYRRCMKWALMWCNHMPPGASREEVWTRMIAYAIGNCFSMPEYYRIDGMPYVSIWDPDCIDRDNGGGGGCRRMLEKARRMARDAGLKGIWFQAMANDDSSPDGGRRLHEKRKVQGFDETTVYHYLGTDGKRLGPRERAYADVASSSYGYWKALASVSGIVTLPNLSTGWDDRPWNDGSTVVGKSPELFRRICASARRFGDETGVRRFCLAPLNEWGEGSYAEPNGEFGFGMFEAIRETFFKKPEGGWPLNYTPADVGRELHEVPQTTGVVPQRETLEWR